MGEEAHRLSEHPIMNDRDYLLLDVFTDRMFGGNQLAVFPDCAGLSAATMQAIARELNLSETVFVLPAEDGAAARLRFFTPAMELPFAGHPTIGAAVALASAGGLLEGLSHAVLAEEAGAVPIAIQRRDDGLLSATLTSPLLPTRLATGLSGAQAARIVGVPPTALAVSGPLAYSAGVPFHFLPLRSVESLAAVTLDLQAWQTHLAASVAPHVVVLAMDDWLQGREIHLRMFAPLMGIAEDPATGAAAAALAGLLVDLQTPADGTHRWTIRQGQAMGRPSTIELEVDVVDRRPAAVRVGGTAVIVGRGTLLGLPVAQPASGSADADAAEPSAGATSAAVRPFGQTAMSCSLLITVAAGALMLLPQTAQAQAFTGSRIEISTGYDALESDGTYEDFPEALEGIHGRIAIGYDAAVTEDVVIGIEASIGGTRDADMNASPGADSFTFRPGRDIDVLVRAGYQLGSRTLLYMKAGWANATLELVERERLGNGHYEVTKSQAENHGLRLGTGAEFRVSDAVYVKGEYRYTRLGDGYPYHPGADRHQLLVGAGYRF
jgi:trans-2,3-dihydro-3-hydroxyanthranilate isomerase